MALNANQECPDCKRSFRGESEADVQPGSLCPSDDCPSNCLSSGDGGYGLICEDVTDGSFVRLDKRHSQWVWECAVWCGNHWSYEGDRIHLTDLRRLTDPDALKYEEEFA